MIKQIINNPLFFKNSTKFIAIDINETDLVACVVEFSNTNFTCLATSKVIGNGFVKGNIVNINKAINSIANLINKCENICGFTIKNIVISSAFNNTTVNNLPYSKTINSKIKQSNINDITNFKQYIEQIPKENTIVSVAYNNLCVDGTIVEKPINTYANNLTCNVTVVSVTNSFLFSVLELTNYLSLELIGIVHLPIAMQQFLQLQNCVHMHIGYKNSWLCVIDSNINKFMYVNIGIVNIIQQALAEFNLSNVDWLIDYLLQTKENLQGKIIEQHNIKVSYNKLQENINLYANNFLNGMLKSNKKKLSNMESIAITVDNINIINLSKILSYYFYNNIYNIISNQNIKNNVNIQDVKVISIARHHIYNYKSNSGFKFLKNNINKLK